MRMPAAPSPEQFGITAEQISRAPTLIFGNHIWLSCLIAAAIGIPLYRYLLDIEAHLLWFVILCNPVGWTLLYFVGVGVQHTMARSERWVRSVCDHKFDGVHTYRVAEDAYLKEKEAYDKWRAHLVVAYWRSLSGVQFENELSKLFSSLGYAVEMTPRTGDGGVDLLLRKSATLTVVQCKAHNKPVSIGVVREFSQCIRDFNAQEGIIACFDGLTRPARSYAADKRIRILDLKDIIRLWAEAPNLPAHDVPRVNFGV